jgi:mono/diheme cytochrome c family protein
MKQNRIFKISILSFLVLAPLLAFQNCSNNMAPMDLDEQALQGGNGSNSVETQALGVLNNKCLSCHGPVAAMGGIDYINDVPSLKYYRVAIPGQAAASPIYTVLSTNDHSSLLAASEVALIYNWVQTGMEATTPGVAPTLVPLGPTYQGIYRNVLVKYCTGCHAGAQAPNLTTYTSLKNSGDIVVGDANNSKLVQRIMLSSGQAGFMPKNGLPLSSAEIQAVKDWINAGALDN